MNYNVNDMKQKSSYQFALLIFFLGDGWNGIYSEFDFITVINRPSFSCKFILTVVASNLAICATLSLR